MQRTCRKLKGRVISGIFSFAVTNRVILKTPSRAPCSLGTVGLYFCGRKVETWSWELLSNAGINISS
jgi:hypothetical protein